VLRVRYAERDFAFQDGGEHLAVGREESFAAEHGAVRVGEPFGGVSQELEPGVHAASNGRSFLEVSRHWRRVLPPFAARLRERVAPAFSSGASGYDPCHDIFHVDRVARNALRLAREEGADADVVASAAYLHDLDRTGEKEPLVAARAHLHAVGASAEFAERVVEAVDRHKDKSFSAGGVRPRSLEARVLSDADKLEAIGAIGIARAFSFGGLKQRPLWDGAPTTTPEVYVSGANGSTIQHFYDKLLRLQPDFQTETARKLAAERHAFLEAYLARFFAEWDGR
jgi:uncharacterized protein